MAATGVVAGLAVLVLAAGCSSGGGDESLPPGLTIVDDTLGARANGDTCNDPAADLESATGQITSQPAGIDLTRGSADISGGTLHLEFDTVGPIASATNPLFVMQQGDLSADLDVSFEIHLKPRTAGRWGAVLKRFKDGRQVPDADLPGTVTVDGTRLVADIPTASLPPVATAIWQFGSSSGVAEQARVIDLCQPFATPAPGGTAPGTSTPGTTGATATPNIEATVGTTATAPDGTKVTVRQVQVPAQANRTVSATAIPGSRLVAVEAEVCAGADGAEQISDRRFSVQTPDGRGRAPWAAPDHTNDPRFNAGVTLRAGECTSGWITYEIPATDAVAAVTYDTSGIGAGPFIAFANP